MKAMVGQNVLQGNKNVFIPDDYTPPVTAWMFAID